MTDEKTRPSVDPGAPRVTFRWSMRGTPMPGETSLREVSVPAKVLADHGYGTADLASSALLNELHGYIAQLCERLGAKREEVPCDIWHLSALLQQLESDAIKLSNALDKSGGVLSPELQAVRARTTARLLRQSR